MTGGASTDDPDVAQLLQVIENNVWKSAALIDDLLALAEAGQRPDRLEDVNIGEVTERVLQEDAGEIEDKGMMVEVEGPMGNLVGSPTHFYQVFSNLIGNSIKHGNGDMPTVTISRLADRGDGANRYLVRDNGAGIPPEDLDSIFAPFFKGDEGGNCIGLATVQKIVNLYGGAIKAYNNGGACFEFTLGDYKAEQDPV